MTISDYLSEIFHDSIKAVAEKQMAISIKITPESESIKIEPWKILEEWKQKNPLTNADRIRNMSDEEIADFLCDRGECDRRCPAKIGDCFFSDSTCRNAWLDWLKQEP